MEGSTAVGASVVGSTAVVASVEGSTAVGASVVVGSTAAGALAVGSRAAGGVGSTAAEVLGGHSLAAVVAHGVGSTAGVLEAGAGSSLEGVDPDKRGIIGSSNMFCIHHKHIHVDTHASMHAHAHTHTHTHLPLLRRVLLVRRRHCLWLLHGRTASRLVRWRLLGCSGVGLRGHMLLLYRRGVGSWGRCLLRVGGLTIALVYVFRDVSALYIVNHCNPLPAGEEHTMRHPSTKGCSSNTFQPKSHIY